MMENTWKTFGKFRKLLGFFGTPLAIIWGKVAAKINAPTVIGVIVIGFSFTIFDTAKLITINDH